MKSKKEELNSFTINKNKKTICGLTIPQLVVFVVLGVLGMKYALIYLIIISTINIFKDIYKERKEYINKQDNQE